MNIGLYFVLLATFILPAFVGYLGIRKMIFSIALCSRNKKYFQKIREQAKWVDRVKMSYIKEHLSKYNDKFDWWMKIKAIYVIVEVLLCTVLTVSLSFWDYSLIFKIISIIILAQSWLVFIIFCTCMEDQNRMTKYDRINRTRRGNRQM